MEASYSMATHCGSACQAIVSHQAVTPCHTALGEAYAPCGAVLLVTTVLLVTIALLMHLLLLVHMLPPPPLTVELVFLLL